MPSVIPLPKKKRCWHNGACSQEFCFNYENVLRDGRDNLRVMFVFDDYFLTFVFLQDALLELFLHWLWIHNEQGHSRQCPSLRCIKHYMIFFSPFTYVYRLYGFISCFSRHQTREAGLSHSMFSDCSKWRYICWSFIRFSWHCHVFFFFFFGDAIFWAGVGWRRPLLSLKALLSDPQTPPPSVQLWPQLTSAFFSDSRWHKQRPYANWQWQVSTWTTAERKTNATSA